jgi:hypothetical protein
MILDKDCCSICFVTFELGESVEKWYETYIHPSCLPFNSRKHHPEKSFPYKSIRRPKEK